MGFDYRYGLLKKIKSEFSLATSPINYIINLPVEMYHNTKNIFKTVKLLTKENQILEKKLYDLSIQIQDNKLLKAENFQLREKLNIQKDFGIVGQNAEIVLPNVRNGYSIITIDKGSKDNIKDGAAVINNNGLVGQIINTSRNYSEIRPITSKTFAVPAILDNGKENIILYGNGNSELEIPLFPASSLIEIGDIFVTSGIDKIYPKGIKIGKVSDIKSTKSPKFNYILVKPFFQPTTFSQLTVLEINKND
tara:strand:- start:453 stop:1202 length:750 start_codon:yes stop_codon:yes gene_type:complete